MNVSLAATLWVLNTSSFEQSSLPGGDNHITFASAYLEQDVTRILWMIVPPVLLLSGCFGNVMTILVMRTMQASESSRCLSVYFTTLAVSDLFHLWTNVLLYWPEMAFNSPLAYFHDLTCAVPFYVSYVSSMTSAWCLVVMTCQRMTSILLPHRVDVLFTAKRGRVITAAIFTTSSMVNLHFLFYNRLEFVVEGYPSCVSTDNSVTSIFLYLYLCLASAIPFLCLVISNSVLISAVVKSVKMSGKMTGHGDTSQLSKVSSMTTTLILTSVAFLLLTLPSCVLLIYFVAIDYYEGEIDDEVVSQNLALAETVCVLLWMSNSAINFYIYILSGRKFRQETKSYLCLGLRQHRFQA